MPNPFRDPIKAAVKGIVRLGAELVRLPETVAEAIDEAWDDIEADDD